MRYVSQKAQSDMITALRDKAKIERFDEPAKPAAPADAAAPAPAPAAADAPKTP